MTRTLLIATTALSLFLSGCAQPAPDLIGKNNVSDVNHIEGETVSIDENSFGDGSTGSYNSSSDGFKSIYFGFADYAIAADMQENMNHNTEVAVSAPSKIKIEGNCDEFGTDEYNYALGLKRAKAVQDSLAAQGIDPDKTMLVSFGESNAVCTEATDSCYQRNRRVDLRLIK
jgi:peptidoglycan-associated lipoprotein